MEDLKKSIGFGTIFALTITAMIGTGMFFGVSIAASHAGNASLISWGILGLITIYVSMCFGELISMFPSAGGVYEFAKRAYGRFVSFFVGWLTWIVGNVTTAVLVVAAVDYASGGVWSTLTKVLIAVAIILILNAVTLIGIEASGGILIFFASVTIVMLLAIIGPGFTHVSPENYTPLLTHSWPLIFLAIFFIIETYFGWESASFLAEETKNAKKVIPPALIWSTIIVACLGFALAYVILGAIPWQAVQNQTTPLLSMARLIYEPGIVNWINIAVIVTLIGSAMGGIVSAPRLLLALSRDRLFIEQFEAIHKKFKTPHRAIYFQTLITIGIVLAGSGVYTKLLTILVPLALLMYTFVILAVPIFRKKFPDMERPFKAFGGRFIPFIIAAIYITVIGMWAFQEQGAVDQLVLAGSFLFWGVPIYILLNMYYNPDWLINATNIGSKVNLTLEKLFLPKNTVDEVIRMNPRIEDKRVLELGCSVGTLTLKLSEKVGFKGKVTAVDFSKSNIDIVSQRIRERGIKNVELKLDSHLVNRIHPDVGMVDAVFSVGFLSYIQDVKKVLKEVADVLPENGKVVFVDYIDLFWVIPNRAWISNRKLIIDLFKDAGFSANVHVKHKFFWKMIYIYAIKTDHDVPVV